MQEKELYELINKTEYTEEERIQLLDLAADFLNGKSLITKDSPNIFFFGIAVILGVLKQLKETSMFVEISRDKDTFTMKIVRGSDSP